ncbi:glycoside hydrolase family 97 catalytic domain-containing protein [Clostridiaceae bacterium NSJ-31]|uniref:Glycoside hydrolase family 97 catalytic domain-containing protein n=1 Tax=Ligaoa zhengdingensis TaxID=2763658 RepID=A0A926I3Z4_9FIRM|nr:glycoside hydrolase family 97 catalytic domain-containing protein [Ligaoa zhengdingensis]MBC8545661.1 glycoside hydrolase family 97 catalytic domain-containing protein [Ligaoa zhengdingensis]
MKMRWGKKFLCIILATQLMLASSVCTFAEVVAVPEGVEANHLEIQSDANENVNLLTEGEDKIPTAEDVPQFSDDALMLADLPWIEATSGTGSGIVLTDGTNPGGYPITLWNGEEAVEYGRGFGVNAPSRISYDISDLSYTIFRATAGVDYRAKKDDIPNAGSCNFQIELDGEIVYDSGLMRANTPAAEIDLEIPAGTKKLTLIVTDGKLEGKNTDWGDWVDARLEGDTADPMDFMKFSAAVEENILDIGGTVSIDVEGTRRNGDVIENILDYCTFASDKEVVATVDGNGTITAVGAGTAIITVTAEVDGIVRSGNVSLTVRPSLEDAWSVTSPSENVELLLTQTADGGLNFITISDEKTVIETSNLGLTTSLGDFTSGLAFESRTDAEIDETYPMISGKKSEYRNHCNESTFVFTKEGADAGLKVIVRAYDDGIAFRYAIDGDESFTISSEATSFQVPADSQTTMMRYYGLGHCYEDEYINGKIEDTVGLIYNMPLLYRTPDGEWALLTEAALNGTYTGSVLVGATGNRLDVKFTEKQGDKPVEAQAPWASPWRTAIIGGAKEIVENTMTENLSEPCKIEDTSWIKPATTAWTWYVTPGKEAQGDPELVKKYIDVAAEFGWKYYLMDEGWQPRTGSAGSGLRWEGIPDWLPDMIEYADSKGIGIMAWVASGDLNTPKKREFIKELADLGIVGMKIDFFNNESQAGMKLYDDIYEACAENHMMLDIHGCNKPTGEIRTWPNLLTREGIKAQEHNTVKADLNSMFVFTRAAVGPADYNPAIDLKLGGNVTAGHKVALNILYETGLPCPSDKAETYHRLKLFTLMEEMPARWDDIHFIEGIPGESATIARRNGEEWYVAAITTQAREAELPLDFLSDGEYYAYLYKDGAGRWDIDFEIQKVTKADTLTIPMKENGGYTVKLVRETPILPEDVTLNQSTLEIQNGSSDQLRVVFAPAESEHISYVEWTSSNDSIVSVDSNGILTAHKLGTAYVTAKVTVPMDGAEAVYTAPCKVTVVRNKSYQLTSPWKRERPDPKFQLNSATSVTLYPLNGEMAPSGSTVKNLLSFEPEDEDFTLTVKCDFAPTGNFMTAGITVMANSNRYVGTWRRYHKGFGGNIFEGILLDGKFDEPRLPDTYMGQPAYLKLEKHGDVFTHFYSLDNATWEKIAEHTLALKDGEKWTITLMACAGANTADTDIPAIMEDFTYNGEVIPFATIDSDVLQVKSVETLDNIAVAKGTAADALGLPATVSVDLANGATTDLEVEWNLSAYQKDMDGAYTLTGTLLLTDGLANDAQFTASVKVVVGEGKKPDRKPGSSSHNSISSDYWNEIIEKINNTAKGGTVNATLESGAMTPATVIDAAAAKGVKLNIEIGGKAYLLSNYAIDASAVHYSAAELIAMADGEQAAQSGAINLNPETGGEVGAAVAPTIDSAAAPAGEANSANETIGGVQAAAETAVGLPVWTIVAMAIAAAAVMGGTALVLLCRRNKD